MVPSGINVPPGKIDKNNNHTPWNNRTLCTGEPRNEGLEIWGEVPNEQPLLT